MVGGPLSAPHVLTLICSEKAHPASRRTFGGLSPLLCAQPQPCVPGEAWAREVHTHFAVLHPCTRVRVPASFCAVGQGLWNGVGGPQVPTRCAEPGLGAGRSSSASLGGQEGLPTLGLREESEARASPHASLLVPLSYGTRGLLFGTAHRATE